MVAAFHKLIPQVFAVGLGQGVGQFCRVEVGGVCCLVGIKDVVMATCQLGCCYAAVGHGAIDHVEAAGCAGAAACSVAAQQHVIHQGFVLSRGQGYQGHIGTHLVVAHDTVGEHHAIALGEVDDGGGECHIGVGSIVVADHDTVDIGLFHIGGSLHALHDGGVGLIACHTLTLVDGGGDKRFGGGVHLGGLARIFPVVVLLLERLFQAAYQSYAVIHGDIFVGLGIKVGTMGKHVGLVATCGSHGSSHQRLVELSLGIGTFPRRAVAFGCEVRVIIHHIADRGDALVGTQLHTPAAIVAVVISLVFVGIVVLVGTQGGVFHIGWLHRTAHLCVVLVYIHIFQIGFDTLVGSSARSVIACSCHSNGLLVFMGNGDYRLTVFIRCDSLCTITCAHIIRFTCLCSIYLINI